MRRGRKALAALLAAGILAGSGLLLAAGDPDQTLVPLSYLNGTYIPEVLEQAQSRIDSATQQTYQSALDSMQASQQGYLAQAGGVSGLSDSRYKRGDVITLPTGSVGLLLAGEASISYTAGAVVDLTQGTVLASGGAMQPRHRYLAAENTQAFLSVSTDTAVLSLEGSTTLSPSTQTDYNALAAALEQMGIFRGTGTGYGSGYDLERTPTRIEGLVMFLRLLGEEDAALACTAACPFSDVPAWAQPYAAYAYEKGYTRGVGADSGGQLRFAPEQTMGAGEYLTFLLRVLGYSDTGTAPDFTWQTALDKGRQAEILTAGEYTLLTGQTFLRAQMAYVSYYALSAPMKGSSGTLLDRLDVSGALDASQVQAIQAGVGVIRIA